MAKNVLEYLNKLWYSIIRNKGACNMKENVGIFHAIDFASYIKYKYNEIAPNKNISPLKLQKALYFCFAYWGAFAHSGNTKQNEVYEEYNDEFLFKDEIQAWVYGPVIPEVYKKKEAIPTCNPIELFEGKEYIKEFIDGVLDDVLRASDFQLVNISHEDKCWERHFKADDHYHNEAIPPMEIIEEYANKF